LVTAGVERVSVLANGNVGIGTTNPQASFHTNNVLISGSNVYKQYITTTLPANNIKRFTIPYIVPSWRVRIVLEVKATSVSPNSSGTNFIYYVGTLRLYYPNDPVDFVTLTQKSFSSAEKVKAYATPSSVTNGNIVIEVVGNDGYQQSTSWGIDISLESTEGNFYGPVITDVATSITDGPLDQSARHVIGGSVGIGTANPLAKVHINDTGAMIIPSGTTAQQPTGYLGMLRFNITKSVPEYHNGSFWVPIGLADGSTSIL